MPELLDQKLAVAAASYSYLVLTMHLVSSQARFELDEEQ
jgi:hypothetical protein